MLLKQLKDGRHEVEIEYTRSVRREGNTLAQQKMTQVFNVIDKKWRGFPVVPRSAFELKPEFERYDDKKNYGIHIGGLPTSRRGADAAKS